MSEDKNKPADTASENDDGAEAGASVRQPGRPPSEVADDTAPPAADRDASEETGTDEPHPVVIIEALQKEISDLKDQVLRAHAEMDNQRKRHERERADVSKYAISKFATDILQVGDNFQRAIDAVPAEAADNDQALKSFLEGVNMAEREFVNTLERHGVKRMNPMGEAFNPHLHQAMMEQEHPTAKPGTILQVIQAGYVLEDRVLRPAMVIVAKAGAGGDNSDGGAGPE